MTDDLLGGPDDNLEVDPTKNYLEELVGEGRKFKTPEELARGKYEADMTIKLFERRQDELRNENLRLRDQALAGAKLQDVIDRLDTQRLSNSEHTPAKEADDKPVIDFDELDKRFDAKIKAHELTQKQDSNFQTVVSKLQEQHGNNYKAVLKQQADSLGLSTEDVNALARKSPDAFFRTFGVGDRKQDLFQSPPNSSRRTDPFAPKTDKLTWTYFQNLKQKDPVAYASAKTHNQMVDSYRELGKEFEDGDFAKFN